MGASGNKWEEESTAKREIVTVSDYGEIERKKETNISDLEFMLNVRKEASDGKAVNVVLNPKSSWYIIINAGVVQWWKMNYCYLIYGICSSLQPGAGAEMCRGATVTAKDTREKAETGKLGEIWQNRHDAVLLLD